MGKVQQIPFCTHDDILKLKKTEIEAIGMITYKVKDINYDLIGEMSGFNEDGKISDLNDVSNRKISRKDIDIKDLEIDLQMSSSTIKRNLKRLEDINIGGDLIPLIYVNKTDNDIVYEINHKTYGKHYTLIDKGTLRKLLIINGTALKLYLIIKYHYEFCKKEGKKCILSLAYLADKIGLKDIKNISDILDIMEGTFIRRKMSYTHKIEVSNSKAHNIIKKYYEYEIIETFNDDMIPSMRIENSNDFDDDDVPW